MVTPSFSRGRTTRLRGGSNCLGVLIVVTFLACPASAQDGRPPESQKSKTSTDKATISTDKTLEIEASRYCANVAPSIAEARIAWQTKRLGELDAQVKQRLADLEKAEASVQEWVAKREALLKAASNDLVAIYAKMRPENAAVQISAMDDQMAAAILGKLKPSAAGAILDEMEADRASKLATLLAGVTDGEKKS
jgi:flagellar motility protein MotE (MotC chaperone)